MHKYKKTKQNKAAILPFSKLSTFFDQNFFMDNKGLASERNHFVQVTVDQISNYFVTKLTPKDNAHRAVKAIFRQRISKNGPLQNLSTDRRSDFFNFEEASCCSLFQIRTSPRTSHAPRTNGLDEVQNRIHATHLRMFLHDNPENWPIRVPFFAYAHIAKPLSHLNSSPYEINFHTQKCILKKFQLNLSQKSFRGCTAQFFLIASSLSLSIN